MAADVSTELPFLYVPYVGAKERGVRLALCETMPSFLPKPRLLSVTVA